MPPRLNGRTSTPGRYAPSCPRPWPRHPFSLSRCLDRRIVLTAAYFHLPSSGTRSFDRHFHSTITPVCGVSSCPPWRGDAPCAAVFQSKLQSVSLAVKISRRRGRAGRRGGGGRAFTLRPAGRERPAGGAGVDAPEGSLAESPKRDVQGRVYRETRPGDGPGRRARVKHVAVWLQTDVITLTMQFSQSTESRKHRLTEIPGIIPRWNAPQSASTILGRSRPRGSSWRLHKNTFKHLRMSGSRWLPGPHMRLRRRHSTGGGGCLEGAGQGEG